jgi:hypothetical protein
MHTLETVYQLAFLVDDLDAAAQHWLRRGAGPFFRIDDFAFTEPVFPQQAALPCLSILLGYSGEVMLELIRVEDDPTGLYTAPVLPRPHHVAVLVEDIDRYLDGKGMRDTLALQAHFPTGTPVAMLDTRPSTGLLTELVTADDAVRGMIAAMREATAAFDGSEPIRSFG